ncbi:4713_t:CDS:2 [Diversispora eburnea]|uniref:4713_t:CDS:1 n=1 Tax=Diversispora eburnea TaxID=1213867 RepID=A0A9N8UY43_9GLOM|nr:4713_t:CDS:2 [Diversispora eburnea]
MIALAISVSFTILVVANIEGVSISYQIPLTLMIFYISESTTARRAVKVEITLEPSPTFAGKKEAWMAVPCLR